jgi:hypothetical protein
LENLPGVPKKAAILFQEANITPNGKNPKIPTEAFPLNAYDSMEIFIRVILRAAMERRRTWNPACGFDSAL